MKGIEATRRPAANAPRTRRPAVSVHKDSVCVREILRVGTTGYLCNAAFHRNLMDAVRASGSAKTGPTLSPPKPC